MIGMLIFLDMMVYLFSSDLSTFSLTSVIFYTIKEGNFDFIKNNLFNIFEIIVSNLVISSGVYFFSWSATGSRETATWNTLATVLLLNLSADFIVIYRYLMNVYPPLTYYLATLIMMPIILIYVFIILEWVRGKD